MMFDFSGHMWSCAVWKSFNQLSSWWLLCKRYAYTLIRVSRHYYVIRMFLLCLCIFVSNKAFLKLKLKFRYWLSAYSAPSHYPNQCWVIVNWNTFWWFFFIKIQKTGTHFGDFFYKKTLFTHENASAYIVGHFPEGEMSLAGIAICQIDKLIGQTCPCLG